MALNLGKETMEYILELNEICKSFGPVVANDKVSIKVRKGCVHAIIGENGAGKSTLMNIVSAVHKPDSGKIILDGKEVIFKDPLDSARHGIGMVYQEFMLFDDLTAWENIVMGFEVRKGPFIDISGSQKKVDEICRRYNYNIPLNEKIKYLPVAILQQIEIVKVLYRGAEIIILDEPTSVLTPQGIQGLFKAIDFLKSQGKTIIIITHKLKEVFEVADYITVLKDGQVVGNVLPSEVDEKKLASMMVGREVILQAMKIPVKIGDPVLEIQHLNYTDGNGIKRLKDVNLDVKAGEILGIAGIAGSGQQFLAEAIMGLLNPDKGSSVKYCGTEIIKQNVQQRRESGISYIPQNRMSEGINKDGTIWENTIMGYHLVHGFGRKILLNFPEIRKYTSEIIKRYSVKAGSQDDRITSLSGGNIQKLIVGREFSMGSHLLVIEDPTRGIDVGAIEFIWAKIIELASTGVAVLLISHELSEIMQLSDRIMVIYNGELSYAGKHGEVDEMSIGYLMAGGKNEE